jgi:hypothetical protein
MNNSEAAAYYRSRATRYRKLADQANDAKRAAQYRELAAAFAKEADRRDGGFPPNRGPSN